eukprot:gene9161-9327_t
MRDADSNTQQVPDEEVQQLGPDLQFVHPASGVQVFVFGVEHLGREPHIGEWILTNRPAAVVVETSCTPDHGAQPGRAVTCRDQVPGAAGMFLRIFCQIAAAMQEQGEAARAPGGVWEQAAGLLQLLQSGSWQSMIGEDGLSSSSPVMQAPTISAEDLQQPDVGARRGLLEAVLQLSMPDEVLQDMQEVLPLITDPQQAAAHEWTLEIYSSYRMQLASLPETLASRASCTEDLSVARVIILRSDAARMSEAIMA